MFNFSNLLNRLIERQVSYDNNRRVKVSLDQGLRPWLGDPNSQPAVLINKVSFGKEKVTPLSTTL